ncbi:Copper transport ATP-binding protein [Halorhabdus tiamatea SARL4B]|uniref:ABC transporter, ATP-binding protein (Probable substrate copper) n=1 Tax=Halorhabdus tiamatea SARL4B TaxID=1033806 RepID=F7PMC5_9EURY|nr:ABC transporter ATP-binding protein [Halorhabdus tiamatea]ERJ05521.1 Copper transport ATP-binding protein [Halorhabdus tiamatea SARL4B]CCQ32891.1 ABC transporter, ATP-binding protein (probable substrate copper) [Halorhabdus tiamatea SARL4B]
MTAIEIDGLHKNYGDLTALDGLDLTVESGEVYGFLGPNGAGKSTTINLLLGFLDPSSGSATVLGHDIVTESQALRRRIGVLPEAFSPYERLTAREHVRYAADLKDVQVDPDALLDRVGLTRDAWDRPAGGFSTGMEQRLALACALVGDPELLILDEPSSGLDPRGMAELRDLIREESADGTTVFFSSHILSEVEAVCDRIGILVDGALVAEGTIDELRDGTETHSPLSIRVDEVPENLDLSDLDGVASVTVEDNTLSTLVTDAGAKIEVIRRVDQVAEIRDVISEPASLEALFDRYANGESLTRTGDDSDGSSAEVTA